MTDIIKDWTTQLAALIEATGAIIIALAAIEAALRAFTLFVRRSLPAEAKEAMRLRLGMWLAVALEFELAADILRTAIAPSWNDVGLLAAIIGLRTILNYFLQLEIEKARVRASNLGQMDAVEGEGALSAPGSRSLSWFSLPHAPTTDA